MSHHGFKGKGSDEWYTPDSVFAWLGVERTRLYDPFPRHGEGGLTAAWPGLTWLNPPYSIITDVVLRARKEPDWVFIAWCRMETPWAQLLMKSCDAVLFPTQRVRFIDGRETVKDGSPNPRYLKPGKTPGAPSMLAARGEGVRLLRHASNHGHGTMLYNGL